MGWSSVCLDCGQVLGVNAAICGRCRKARTFDARPGDGRRYTCPVTPRDPQAMVDTLREMGWNETEIAEWRRYCEGGEAMKRPTHVKVRMEGPTNFAGGQEIWITLEEFASLITPRVERFKDDEGCWGERSVLRVRTEEAIAKDDRDR